MKKFIKVIVVIVILGLVSFGAYKFFFAVEKVNTVFDRNFVLEKFDYARISDKVTVKLIAIQDNRCKDKSCDKEGQFLVKFIIKDDRHIAYETLGSLSESTKDLTQHKLNYSIELVDVNSKNATFKVQELED